jgi:hypothetical protein
MRTNATVAIILLFVLGLIALAKADEHDQDRDKQTHDWVIERQEDYMVQGPPTDRIINGRRELDGYRQPDGSTVWFDRDRVTGITPPR